MAAAVNHMLSLLQSRTAFHSTVNVGCVPIRGDCSPQTTNNSLLFYSILDYNPTVFTDCPFFTTRYTATNFNEQPATNYLLNRTVGFWLHSLLQLPSNHQLMFLTAPLTAFKHDSEAAGFWYSHNFQRCQLAAFPFAAPPNNHQLIISSLLFFFASTRQPPISTLCCLRFTILHRLHFFCTHETTTNFQTVCWLHSLLQLTSNHQLMFLTAPLTAFKYDSEAAGQLAAFPFAAPLNNHQLIISSLLFFCIHQTGTNFNGNQ
ncbi:hypothetical protein OUZ56_011713 [Daphnia magna]|uniref:Uncharacterized protein n=1 Tax=Daphnia magna TaxID=35525 RepID=A0ABQ9Z0X8_9CRUS|nr:hypothetical protein OUZ56_011713 [Daphnia magna]